MNPVETGPIQDNSVPLVAPVQAVPPNPATPVNPLSAGQSFVSAPAPIVSSPVPRAGRFTSLLQFNRVAFWVTGVAIVLIVAIGVTTFLFLNHQQGGKNQANATYGASSLPLQNAQAGVGLLLGRQDKLAVNGQLQVNDTLVLAPGKAPASPVVGQLYYDKTSNQPYYYNGASFVSLLSVTSSPQKSTGASGANYQVGSGLVLSGNQLSVAPGILQAANVVPASDSYIENQTATTQAANFSIRAAASGSVAAVIQANAAGSGDILDLRDGAGRGVVAIGATGATIISPSVNMDGAFQVQDASGAALVSANTATKSLTVSGANGGLIFATAPTHNWADDITVSGNYAYVVNSDDTLQVFNVSNPSVPVSVAAVNADANSGNSPNAVAVSGNYAYVVNSDDTLQVFNVSTPSNPVPITNISTGSAGYNWPSSVSIVGNYLYLTDGGDGTFQLYDIAAPTSPVLVGTAAITGTPYDFAVAGNYAYVLDYADGTMQVFDIAAPSNPTLVNTVATYYSPSNIVIKGNDAYVVGGGALQVFDLSAPSSPVAASTTYSDFANGANGSPHGLAISGSYAYVSNADGTAFQVYDISVPSAPTLVSTVKTYSPTSIALAGNAAFVTDPSDSVLNVFNITDPTRIQLYSTSNPSALEVNGAASFQAASDTNSAFRIQNAQGSTLLNVDALQNDLSINTDLTVNGNQTLIQNTRDSTAAFQVQDAENNNVVNVDTTNHTVTVSGVPGNWLDTNLITHTDFSDSSYWSTSDTGNWTLAANSAAYSGFNGYLATTQFTATVGDTYAYSFVLSGGAGGDDCVRVDVGGNTSNAYCGAGVYSGYATATSTEGLKMYASTSDATAFVGTLSNISVQQVNAGGSALEVQAASGVQTQALGVELSPDTDFTNVTDWAASPSGDWTLTPTAASWGATTSDTLTDNQVYLKANTNYQISFMLNLPSPDYLFVTTANFVGGAGFAEQYVSQGTNTFDVYTYNASGAPIFELPGTAGSISNVSIKELSTTTYNPAAISVHNGNNTLTLEVRAPDDTSVYVGLGSGANDAGTASNAALGDAALHNNTSGNQNAALGYGALETNVTGYNDAALGYKADVGSGNLQNATAIGAFAQVNVSNGLVLGCVAGALNCYQATNVGIGTSSPANLLSVGDLTTASPNTQVVVSTGGATNSGIVVQNVSGQTSGYAFQAQDNTGVILASIDYKGNIVVKSATITGVLTINGHLVTANSSGATSAAVDAAAGSGGSPGCTVSGDDTAGLITLTTGTSGWAAGAQCSITFSTAFTGTPHPVLTPTGTTNDGSVLPTVTPSTSGFTVNFINADTAQHTYTWDYFNAQ